MLLELRVENFAIIDRLAVEFHAGLIAFTGETGAGKSILVDALETILGGRAEANMVRAGAERASVEAVFRLSGAARAALQTVLEREDLADDPETVTLGREIRANGRSTARVNGRSVSAGLLRELGELLVDVHGQSEHLSLLRVSQHLPLLDHYAGAEAPLAAYRLAYQQLTALRRELGELRLAEGDAARQTDMLNFQIQEIEAARLRPGEEEELRQERNRLANAEGLASLAQEAVMLLDEGSPDEPAVTDLLGKVVHAAHGLARLDASQAAIADQAETLFDGLTDLAHSLRGYLETVEFNPKRLDQVEERLGLFHMLKRKYGDTLAAVLAYAETARRKLEAITHASERISELENDETLLLEQIGKLGEALSAAREKAAASLAAAVEQELADLSMNGARFQVDFQRRPDPQGAPVSGGQRLAFDLNGLEKVEFLIAPNPGEGLKPLAKIASGGETSRLMLALKNVLAQADPVPTLIFDEIDQGIGGRVGAIVGQKLWTLARRHQVLCITHLPQLAAYGEQHFQVQKQVQDGRTSTQVEALAGEPRLRELAQMFGEVSDGTLQSARELLGAAMQRAAASAAKHSKKP